MIAILLPEAFPSQSSPCGRAGGRDLHAEGRAAVLALADAHGVLRSGCTGSGERARIGPTRLAHIFCCRILGLPRVQYHRDSERWLTDATAPAST